MKNAAEMEPAAQVLVVSPDAAVLEAARACIESLGHRTAVASTVTQARRTAARLAVDLVCLDSSLPAEESERLWRSLSGGDTPALLLAPRSANIAPATLPAFYEPERHGLTPKPLDGRELAREVVRLLAAQPAEKRRRGLVRVGAVALDSRARRLLFADGGAVALTPTETRLLTFLMERPGEHVPAGELLEQVWDLPRDMAGPEIVRAHVSNLRRKLRTNGHDAGLLRTIPYQGYAFIATARSS